MMESIYFCNVHLVSELSDSIITTLAYLKIKPIRIALHYHFRQPFSSTSLMKLILDEKNDMQQHHEFSIYAS